MDAFICLYIFRLYDFVEAAALRSIVLRYAGTLIATRVSFFFPFVYLEMLLFPCTFCTISVFSLYYIVRSFLPNQVFSYLVTTGWIFYISFMLEFKQSINQSISPEPQTQPYRNVLSKKRCGSDSFRQIGIRNYVDVCIVTQYNSKSMDQPGKVANPARSQLNRKK